MSNFKHSFFRTLLYAQLLSGFSGVAIAAQISLSVKDRPMREVIKELEETTEYRFFYNDGIKGLNSPISVDVEDADINAVMDAIAKQANVAYVLKSGHQIVLSSVKTVQQQGNKKVTGTITDPKGEPIIGANVVVKGSTNGTITDIDGHFSIEVTPNAILQVSYIGYVAQDVPVGNKDNLVISIHEDTQKLNEKVDGVLIATLFTDSVIRLSQELDRNEIPFVYVDSNIGGQHQLAYFGTESYDAGVIAARLLMDRLSSSSDILMARIIHSGKNDSNQGKNRREGFCHYLTETGFNGNLHEVELKINDSVYNFMKLDEIFEANPNINGAVIFNSTCYILGNYLKARGMQSVKLVGYDLIGRNTQLLSEGVITALIAQRPERQGYDGIKSLCNHLLFKQGSEKVNLMPIDILLKENLKYYLNNKL